MSSDARIDLARQLRESEERYRLIFDHAGVGIAIADSSGRFLRCNARFALMVGYGQEDLTERTFKDISHPDDVALATELFLRLVRGESEFEEFDRRYIRRDGSLVWAHVALSAARHADGKIAYVIGVVEDITARRAAIDQVWFQTRLLESVRQAVAATDRSGRITFWNGYAEQLYGWTAAEVLGRKLIDVVPAPASADQSAAIVHALASGESWTGEFLVKTRSERLFTALLTMSPVFDADGSAIGSIGVSQDISEIRGARLKQAALARLGTIALSTGLDFLFNRSAEVVRDMLRATVVEFVKIESDHLLVVGRAGQPYDNVTAEERNALGRYAFRSSSLVAIERTAGEPSTLPADAEPGVVRGISVIVTSSDQQRWGVITASMSDREHLSAADVDFLHAVANLIGQAIERRRAEVELRIRAVQQSAIAEIGRMTSAGVTDAALDRACELVMQGIGLEHASLFRTDGVTGTIEISGDREYAPKVVAHARQVFDTGVAATFASPGINGVAAPIAASSRKVGVICGFTTVPKHITAVDVQFMDAVAVVLAEAMQREAARAALIESERRFRSVVEGASEIIFSINPTGVILSLNPAFDLVTGWRADDWIGRHFADLIAPEDRQAKLELFASVLSEPRHIHMQMRLLGKSEIVLLDISSSPKVTDGRVVEIYGFARDITEERRLEVKLEQANRLSSLGRLAATVAHEFNNVLMGISPFTEILQRQLSDDNALGAIDQILRSVKRGKRITEDILRFAQPAEPVMTPVNVAVWLSAFAIEAQSLIGPAYEVVATADADMRIAADAYQMHQAFVNLIVNARDSMPGGGTITIEAVHESPGARFTFGVVESPERFVHFIMKDEGAGINAETLDHIFEPLFTTKKTGTGLGLPVARQVVTRHGGEIFVESTPGIGTSFHLFIPLAAAQQQARADEPAAIRRRIRRVLLVEDEQAVAAGLAFLLESEGITVNVVGSGREVMPALSRQKPDAVILDIGLPDVDGTTVYMTIAKKYPNLPVVFSSGHGDAARLDRFLVNPRVGFLLKPYDIDALLQTLDRVMP